MLQSAQMYCNFDQIFTADVFYYISSLLYVHRHIQDLKNTVKTTEIIDGNIYVC